MRFQRKRADVRLLLCSLRVRKTVWLLTFASAASRCHAGTAWHDPLLSSKAAPPAGLLYELPNAHQAHIYTIAFSDDGLLATGARDSSLAVRNVSRGFGSPRSFKGHVAGVTALAFVRPSPASGASDAILLSGSADNTTRIWDVRTAQVRKVMEHPRTVFGIAVSKSMSEGAGDGSEFATACWDGIVRVFHLPSGAQRASLEGHDGGLYSVAYSPLDGTLLASASADRTVRVWDVKTMTILWTLRGHSDHVTSVDWSPSSPLTLASGGWDRKLLLWELPHREAQPQERVRPRVMGKHPQLVWRVAFAPTGEKVAVCHGAVGQNPTVVFYDIVTGTVYRRLGRHKDTPLSIAWSADGSMLASTGMDRRVLVYDGRLAESDMPQGDLDDAEEQTKWLQDLASLRPAAQNQSQSEAAGHQNDTSQAASMYVPHPLAGRAAYY